MLHGCTPATAHSALCSHTQLYLRERRSDSQTRAACTTARVKRKVSLFGAIVLPLNWVSCCCVLT